MDSNTILLLVLMFAVVVLGAIILMQRRRSTRLKEQFGPEYQRTVEEKGGDQRRAEAELSERKKRVRSFDIHPLIPEQRDHFAAQWKSAQLRFVDDPSAAIKDADLLVMHAMEACGYPVGDFEQRAADISVNHPQVVDNYREAHKIAQLNDEGKASTEDLRLAMVRYRALFDDLLAVPEPAHSNTMEAVH